MVGLGFLMDTFRASELQGGVCRATGSFPFRQQMKPRRFKACLCTATEAPIIRGSPRTVLRARFPARPFTQLGLGCGICRGTFFLSVAV